MGRTSIGTRIVRDESITRDDIDTTTAGEALITKILAGSGINISWTGADPGTGDVVVTATGASGTPVPLESFEVNDQVGGQQLTATPITIDLDPPRYANANYVNVGGEVEFLITGMHLVMARVTAEIVNGANRSESRFYLEQDIGAGWETIPGTIAILYHRVAGRGGNTATVACVFNATAGHKVRIRAYRSAGNDDIRTVNDGSNIVIVNLIGAKGAKGDKGDKGDPGLDGNDGLGGINGTDGSKFYTGAGAPSDTLGNNTDLYLNTNNSEYYQKSGGTWGLPIGVFSSGGLGVTDHANLTGLFNDDHTQYFNQTRGDIRYSQIGHTHTLAEVIYLRQSLQKIETLHWMGLS